jgi:hypothetical protein
MKKYFLFTAFILIAATCFSQDYIYLKSGEVLEVTILEEGSITVRYRIFDDASKKMYFVEKTDIKRIVFQNGKEVTYSSGESRKQTQPQTQIQDEYDENRNSNGYNRRPSGNYATRKPPVSYDRRDEVEQEAKTPFSQIHAGVVLPQGDADDGFATGFNLGYKHYSPLSASNLSFVFGLNAFYNGLDSDYKDALAKGIANEIGYSVDITTASASLNFSAIGGLNFAYPVSDKLDIYGEAAGGINFSQLTNTKADIANGSATLKLTFAPGFKFCYAFGGGILIEGKYSIGLQYNNLNSYEYKSKIKVEGGGTSESGDAGKLSVASLNNLTIALGLLF